MDGRGRFIVSKCSPDNHKPRSSRHVAADRFFSVGLILGAFAACVGSAAPALAQTSYNAATVTTVSGVVSAKLTLSFASAPPTGSTVSCAVALIGSDSLSPSDSESVNAPVSGSSAVCNLTIHYKWRIASLTSTMTIAYSVSGPLQDSSAIYEVITMPPNGATTIVTNSVQQ